MTHYTKAELLQRYKQITFYPAADDGCGWVSAVLAKFCPAGGRVLDPFCGTAIMSLVAALDGYQGIVSDSNPLTEVFVQLFRNHASFFADIEIDLDALDDPDARAIVEQIYRSEDFDGDAASIHALLFCASRVLTDDGPREGGSLERHRETYRRVKADAATFIAALKPHAEVLDRNLTYRIGDISGIDVGLRANVCLFDPPYFGRSSFAQFCSPLLALLGRRESVPDDQALLADETMYQQAMSGWLMKCYDALDADGAIVFTVSPGAREQRRQVLDAARGLGLTVAEATHDGKPYLYAPKPGMGKIR